MERPDEISVTAAATLLAVTPRRIRQLAADGFIVVHRRGFTSVGSAISGYIKALRSEGQTSATTAAAARQHEAKAALTRSFTAKRRAALTVRTEAEEAVQTIADAAVRRLRDTKLPASIPVATGQTFRAEIIAACARIEEAKARALAALATGDLTELEGDGQ